MAFAGTRNTDLGTRSGTLGKDAQKEGGGTLGLGAELQELEGRGCGLGGGAKGGTSPSSTAARATSPLASVWGRRDGGRYLAGKKLSLLARAGDGSGGGGGLPVRVAWGRGGEAASASELRHTGPGIWEPDPRAGSWWRR